MEIRRAQFQPKDGFPLEAIFQSPGLFSKLSAGMIHRKSLDLFWDTKNLRWARSPVYDEEAVGTLIDKGLLYFQNHPLVQSRIEALKREIASTLTAPESEFKVKQLKAQLDDLLPTPGKHILYVADKTGAQSPVHFVLGENGFIQSVETWNNNILIEGAFNRVTNELPFIPTEFDSSLYNEHPPPNLKDNGLIGIRLAEGKDKLTIAEVAPNSPAEKAGMVPGEELLSVNGKKLQAHTQQEFMAFGRGTTSLTIETKSNSGETKRFTVPKKLVLHLPQSR